MANLTDTKIYGNLQVSRDLYINGRKVEDYWDIRGQKIMATDPEASDNFGFSASISGDYAIVGAPWEDTGGNAAGAAYIYRRTGTNTWGEGFKIMATDPHASDNFGFSASISGDYAIVGADYEDTGGTNAGAAYIYRRTGANTWGEGFKIKATDPQVEDYFGSSVAISGNYAIVGAYKEDTGGTNAGAAYIYRRTDTNTWGEGFKIQATDPQAEDFFGISVDISGDYAIVGSRNEDTGGYDAGAAYIYRRTGTNTWGEGFKIMASDPQYNDQFGWSVAISGDYAIVGAYQEDTGGTNAGAAYIYRRTDTNTWGDGVKIMATDPQANGQFGRSVSISGDYAIVGAYYKNTGGSNAGAAYIYRRTGTNTWGEGFKIKATNPEASGNFGNSVSISGDYAIVGAHYEFTGGINAGAAYIYNIFKHLRLK